MSNFDPVSLATAVHIRDTCLCLATQRAARALARRFDDAFRPLGLTSGQFSLMISLNREAPPSIGAVAKLLAMDRTTLTANLKPLERRRWVATMVDPKDRRGRLVALTDDGRALIAEAVSIWEREHARAERPLEGGCADTLRAGLKAVH